MQVSLFLFPSPILYAPSIVSLLCCMPIFFLNSYPKHEKYIYGVYTTIWSRVDNHHYCRTCWRWTRPPRQLRTRTWRNTYISAIINPHKQYIYISLCPIWLISHPSYALTLIMRRTSILPRRREVLPSRYRVDLDPWLIVICSPWELIDLSEDCP